VIVPAPYWTTYPEAIALAGGRTVVVPTTEKHDFRVTTAQLDAALTTRTKALLFVSPSNPTGSVYPPDAVEEIARWAIAHGLWVITDEIYEHLTFGDHQFVSIPAVVPEAADTCIVLNGVAKTYAMTGWRVGWMIAPLDVITAATNLQSHSTSNVSNVAQRAALAAVAGDLQAVAEMRAAFERRGKTMHAMLSRIPGVTCMEPQGAFYCFPNFEGVLGRQIAGRRITDTVTFCEVLLDAAKVAIVPGEAFGAPGYARLSFALGDDDLGEGVERIAELLAG
jgi:aspartate aminotransferase